MLPLDKVDISVLQQPVLSLDVSMCACSTAAVLHLDSLPTKPCAAPLYSVQHGRCTLYSYLSVYIAIAFVLYLDVLFCCPWTCLLTRACAAPVCVCLQAAPGRVCVQEPVLHLYTCAYFLCHTSESVATLTPFGPIEGQKWFDRISSQ